MRELREQAWGARVTQRNGPPGLAKEAPPPRTHVHPSSLSLSHPGTNLFTLPLSMGFYLPLSEIQFRAEELEYTGLLDAAAQAPKGSVERATLVAGFALSHYAATVRLDKPFLPMHGETFDIYLPEKGVRVLAETVYTNFKENTCVEMREREGGGMMTDERWGGGGHHASAHAHSRHASFSLLFSFLLASATLGSPTARAGCWRRTTAPSSSWRARALTSTSTGGTRSRSRTESVFLTASPSRCWAGSSSAP